MIVDDIHVTVEKGSLNVNEINYYIHKIKKISPDKKLKSLALYLGDGFVDMRYSFHQFPFERIRRINTFTFDNEKRVV